MRSGRPSFAETATWIKRAFADGDHVTLHVHAVREPGTRGTAIVDMFMWVYSRWGLLQVNSAGFRSTDQCFRFSNRPVGVKRFQTIHHCGLDVARGLVLLFGIGTKALPLWDSKTRRNNLWGGRQRQGRSKRTCELTSSIVPRGTSFHG